MITDPVIGMPIKTKPWGGLFEPHLGVITQVGEQNVVATLLMPGTANTKGTYLPIPMSTLETPSAHERSVISIWLNKQKRMAA